MGNSDCIIGEDDQKNPRQILRKKKQLNEVTLKTMIQMKKRKLIEEYEIISVLGKGTFGSVLKAIHKESNMIRAVKKINRDTIPDDTLKQFFLLKHLDHPNIVRIFQIFLQHKYIYIVMEFCEGGQLFNRIIKKNKINQHHARKYIKQMLSAIVYCHKNNIMHRDLKPQNIMFLNQKDQTLKIIDFGAGTSYLSNTFSTLKIGSLYYVAPEVLKKKYNQKCDLWSLGVILFTMLSGTPPFSGKTNRIVLDNIIDGKFTFSQDCWKQISIQAQDLIKSMLIYAPTQRISAKEALRHSWFEMQNVDNIKVNLSSSLNAIQDFCNMNDFQSAIMTYITHHLVHNKAIYSLQNKFKQMDVNGDGKISLSELKNCYLIEMPSIDPGEFEMIFRKIDKNHSGYIDYSQFLNSALEKNYVESENLFDKAFDLIDSNKDGLLTREQMQNAFGGTSELIYESVIDKWDLDNDGCINRKEFKLAMRRLQQQ